MKIFSLDSKFHLFVWGVLLGTVLFVSLHFFPQEQPDICNVINSACPFHFVGWPFQYNTTFIPGFTEISFHNAIIDFIIWVFVGIIILNLVKYFKDTELVKIKNYKLKSILFLRSMGIGIILLILIHFLTLKSNCLVRNVRSGCDPSFVAGWPFEYSTRLDSYWVYVAGPLRQIVYPLIADLLLYVSFSLAVLSSIKYFWNKND